ncbi:MAG: MarR family winged helix-turn-helix transcriptional regulator [Oscillospiraceae bacterium]
MNDPEDRKREQIGCVIKNADLEIKRTLLFLLRSDGVDEVTATHGFILGYLSDHSDQDIFQRDLEAHLKIGRSSVTTVLNLMEKNGYVTRSLVDKDGRLRKISLTEKGTSMNLRIRKIIDRMESSLLDGLSESEKAQLYELIEKVRSNAEKQRR